MCLSKWKNLLHDEVMKKKNWQIYEKQKNNENQRLWAENPLQLVILKSLEGCIHGNDKIRKTKAEEDFPHNSVPTVVMGSQFFEQIMIMAVTCPPLKQGSRQEIYFVVAPSSF